ncbi:iron chaperone [Sporolactobacillus pectinivorans]|uniref:iron chaperone n=1 Tax=Sporolactobacillus pectinivorans TaxID=1591408 RepID=UPI000C25C91E|nr:DUF1801 domain-containing protein [Sporolactobacillus pectinivorans]
MEKKKNPDTIDAYIAAFPADVQEKLKSLRAFIQQIVPGAKEKVSYQMPTFTLNGRNLVHFAAFKKHIGFYPGASGIAAFEKELSAYETSKGTVRFPFEEPVPLDLISKIVKFRAEENMGKYGSKN